MANIVVLPRIEIDNPFSELAEILKNETIPMIGQLTMNKEQIAILSDTKLTDHIPILRQFAPELLTQDDKIDWNKVEEYLQSDDLFKQEVANYLINARKSREEFVNLPIGVKLEKLGFYSAKSNPQILKKNFMARIISEKYQEMIKNSNLSEDAKLFLLAHTPELAEKVVQNPAYFTVFLKILDKHSKQQNIVQQENKTETEQDNKASSWQLSLDGQQKKFGIKLEEPRLVIPQISFPQVSKTVKQKRVKQEAGIKQGSVDKIRSLPSRTEQVKPLSEETDQTKNKTTENQQLQMQTSDEIFLPSEVLYAPDVKNMLSREELKSIGKHALIDLALLALLRDPRALFRTGKGVIGKTAEKIARKNVKIDREIERKVLEAMKPNPNTPTTLSKEKSDFHKKLQKAKLRGMQNTTNPPDPQEVFEISGYKQNRKVFEISHIPFKETPNPQKVFEVLGYKQGGKVFEIPYIPSKETRWAFGKATPPKLHPEVQYEKLRQKMLPVLAQKETRWEFANAKPPAVVFREGRMTDYIPPQFERVSAVKLKEQARQKKLPAIKEDTAIMLKPKETPYKEAVAQQGFKTSQILEEFLKKTQPTQPKVETKEAVLKPIKKLENLVKEIPEEAKNDPEIRRRFVEIVRDLKKISKEAPFRDVSDDLRVLDAKADELKVLLRKKYGETKTATNEVVSNTKRKKSNK